MKDKEPMKGRDTSTPAQAQENKALPSRTADAEASPWSYSNRRDAWHSGAHSDARRSDPRSSGAWSSRHVLQLQRAIGNRAVTQWFSRVVQRVGEEEESEPEQQVQEQMQIQALPNVPDYRREAYALEREAIEAANRMAILREELESTTDIGELNDVNDQQMQLASRMSVVFQRASEISAALADGPGGQPEVEHALGTVTEIKESVTEASIAFRRRWAAIMHRDALDSLEMASDRAERRRVGGLGQARHPMANDTDRREINNWVSGSAGPMNRMLFGRLSEEDRGLQDIILRQGDANNRWAWDLDARSAGLQRAMDKIPKFKGTTYRKATAENDNVYRSLIHPGDLVMSKGFMATSMLKGAEGAGGGQEAWGKGNNVYFQITGVTGTDLGPYQDALQGEREVLYPAESVFEVKAIKYKDATVFVILSQVLLIPDGVQVKDPYTGEEVDAPVDLT